ncbi:hypothetical protein ALC62_08231, partial [Cyphomyrmex costatus]
LMQVAVVGAKVLAKLAEFRRNELEEGTSCGPCGARLSGTDYTYTTTHSSARSYVTTRRDRVIYGKSRAAHHAYGWTSAGTHVRKHSCTQACKTRANPTETKEYDSARLLRSARSASGVLSDNTARSFTEEVHMVE